MTVRLRILTTPPVPGESARMNGEMYEWAARAESK